MKKIITLFLLALFLLVITSQGASSVELKKSYTASTISQDDLRLSLRLVGGKGAVVRRGRSISFTIQVSDDAYVVVYNIDSEGYVHLLFPFDGKPEKLEAGKIYYFPERGSDLKWIASGDTGIEYLHAIAVREKDRLKEEELYYLIKNSSLPEDKRFRIDGDPFTAFNMIDEELVAGAEEIPPATDYTYFYINRRVEYPRYLCYRCHGDDGTNDPYSDECTEVTIDRISYDEEPSYPYPPLYEVAHVSDSDHYETDRYSERWMEDNDYDENDTNVYLSIFYTNYDYPYRYYWPPFGFYIAGVAYPLWWDDFWWGFGWSIGWADYYYFYRPFYTWWTPFDYYWTYRYRYDRWWRCTYCEPYYTYRPIYGTRRVVKRTLDYRKTYSSLHRSKVLANSRLVKRKSARLASRYERTNTRSGIQRKNMYSPKRIMTGSRRLEAPTRRDKRRVYSPTYNRKGARIRAPRETRKTGRVKAPEVKRNPESRRTLKSNTERRNKPYDPKRPSRTIKNENRRAKPANIHRYERRVKSPVGRNKKTYRSREKNSTKARKSSPRTVERINNKARNNTWTKPSSITRSTRMPSRPATPVKSRPTVPSRVKRR